MMRVSGDRRGDFVLAMSLAEVILLLVFSLFVAHVLGKESGGGQDPTIILTVLREENEELRKRILRLETTLTELQRELKSANELIEQLRRMVGAGGPNLESFREAIVALKRRGHPKCLQENTLIGVVSTNRIVEVVILGGDEAIRELRENEIQLQKGQTIKGGAQIDMLLNALWQYQNRPDKKCRFDYNLTFPTPEDYHLGREKFERFLYPGKMVERSR